MVQSVAPVITLANPLDDASKVLEFSLPDSCLVSEILDTEVAW